MAMFSWAMFKFVWNIDDEMRAKIAAWKLSNADQIEDEEVVETLEDEAVAAAGAAGAAIIKEPLMK